MTAQHAVADQHHGWSTVAVVGPGRVGTALAAALDAAGHRIVAVAGRATGAGADAAADRVRSPSASLARFVAALPQARPATLADVADGADLVLLTVGDDGLPGTVRELAAGDLVRPGSRWVHTSGRYGVGVLRPIAAAGGRVAACHPAQTFPTPDEGRRALPGTAWAVTAAAGDRPWAYDFVAALRGTPVDVREHDRVRYHAALVVGSNGTSAVVALARDLLLSAGIDAPGQFLEPLVTRSAANAATAGAAALTGPVRRGDAATVRAHLDDLSVTLPEAVPAYRALALLALSYARRAGLPAADADAILAILDIPTD